MIWQMCIATEKSKYLISTTAVPVQLSIFERKKEKSFRVVYIIHLFLCKSLFKVWVKLWKYVSANLLLHRIHVFCKINIHIVPFYA